MSSTHSLSRKIRNAWATASYTLPALTSTACLTSLRSKQETLHAYSRFIMFAFSLPAKERRLQIQSFPFCAGSLHHR